MTEKAPDQQCTCPQLLADAVGRRADEVQLLIRTAYTTGAADESVHLVLQPHEGCPHGATSGRTSRTPASPRASLHGNSGESSSSEALRTVQVRRATRPPAIPRGDE